MKLNIDVIYIGIVNTVCMTIKEIQNMIQNDEHLQDLSSYIINTIIPASLKEQAIEILSSHMRLKRCSLAYNSLNWINMNEGI